MLIFDIMLLQRSPVYPRNWVSMKKGVHRACNWKSFENYFRKIKWNLLLSTWGTSSMIFNFPFPYLYQLAQNVSSWILTISFFIFISIIIHCFIIFIDMQTFKLCIIWKRESLVLWKAAERMYDFQNTSPG